jgi:hypothetical protein
MDEFIKLLDENLLYLNHEIVGDTNFIHVVSNRGKVVCPYCGRPSVKFTYVKEEVLRICL